MASAFLDGVNKQQAISKIQQTAEHVADPAGIEVVEVELKGSGNNQLLRVVIDKPEGVSHGDCETISRGLSEALDAEDPISGSYQLEVTSPGVERKLLRWRDWERFKGQKVKVVLKEPVEDLKHFEGTITRAENDTIAVEIAGGRQLTFPFSQVDRANLKFEW